MNLRESISAIVGTPIPEGGWYDTFHKLDVAGRLTARRQWEILVAMCKKVEELENDRPEKPSKKGL